MSGDPGVGGIDQFSRETEDLITKLNLPIKGVKVWHFDEICRYLDLYPNIRATYGALTTAGDILFRLRELLEGTAADLGELLANHSSKEMLSDQWVRLGQAGEADNQRLPLAEVAIDPTATINDRVAGTHETANAARHILAHGDAVLRPSRTGNVPPHIALIGGPGQGKTTISQMVCQAYRVALLQNSIQRLDVDTAEVVEVFSTEMDRMGLTVPASRRWPIRVNLSGYADAIAGSEDISILRFLASQISARTPDIKPNQLRAWLKAWPWLLVLDGLDEVASSQARDLVMERVNDFLIDAHSVDADLLVVATSRPQGYREEFSPNRYVHMRLEPLPAEDAVAYAKQLTHLRHRGDPETASQVLHRLEDAAEDELTARLMSTPLQVTIMAILLERRERVPQQRYRLFSDYYQTIYNREAGKRGMAAKLVDEYREAITHLHERVGLLLQTYAEREGNFEASLSLHELAGIVQGYLAEEGYGDPESVALADRIVDAATRRLVLLVPRKEESVGFEIRSLQEFMAARAIVSGDVEVISARLKLIAPSAHWRNTWLLAAGRIFADYPSVRDRLVTLLDEIQAADTLSLYVKPGSMLAVELLKDDVAAKSPRFLRCFVKQAIELLDSPFGEDIQYDLADTLWPTAAKDVAARKAVEQAVSKTLSAGGMGAVGTISFIVGQGPEAGALAQNLRKHIDQAKRNLSSLEKYVGLEILSHGIVDHLRDGGEFVDVKPMAEAVEPFIRVSASVNKRELLAKLLPGQTVSFIESPERVPVMAMIQFTGERSEYDPLQDADFVECLIETAEKLPVSHWLANHKIWELCQAYQERRPVGPIL